jgi:hypothetical protein
MCNVMYHDKAILLTSDKESELVFDFFFWDIAVFPIRNESTLKKILYRVYLKYMC